jgi:tagatose 1,6-diphosphate aldolase
MITMGKYRQLSHTSTSAGHFSILAIDHRSNLLERLNQTSPTPLSDEDFSDFKILLMQHVLPPASGILADPGSAIGKGIANRLIHGHQGIIAPIEVTDYNIHPSQRDMNWIPNWSIAKLKRIGGSGVKILLPYHPKSESADYKRSIVEQVIEQCTEHDIPLYLEPIAHALDADKTLSNAELLDVVLQMATEFPAMGADVLKMQFPVDAKQSDDESEWRSACEKLNEACTVPWALLSAGVTYDTFERQAKIACQAGASGVIVGRAVWAEAVDLQGDARIEFLQTTARQRMTTLAQICADYAQPWFERVGIPENHVTWYETY